MDIAKLKTQLAAGHPVTGAYNADDTLAAAEINLANVERVKPTMSGDEIFAATNTAEFAGLTDHKQQVWLAFSARETVNPSGSANVALVNWVFGGASSTLTALAAARTELISQATSEGLGEVSFTHVTQARAYHG